MGYLHIPNLYKEQTILGLDEVYAMEKIHGTSAHIRYKAGEITYFSGGENYEAFRALFAEDYLKVALDSFQLDEIIIYGEAYGGKQQGMRATYGDTLKFVVFDVKCNGKWLRVPQAAQLTAMLKLEFVHYVKVPTKLEILDQERDADSVQAIRNGVGPGKKREGIVLRPLEELIDTRGRRLIAKHKIAQFGETKTKREVTPDKQKVLSEATAIAVEWVTEMRLDHILDQAQAVLNNTKGIEATQLGLEDTRIIIGMMIEDIKREAKGEILESPAAMKAIGTRTAQMFRQRLEKRLREAQNV